MLEERFWRPVEEGSTLEALRDDDALVTGARRASRAVRRPRDRPRARHRGGRRRSRGDGRGRPAARAGPSTAATSSVGLAVMLTYVHDVGMHDPTPAGRRIHALYAAHFPFSGAMDDVLDRLSGDGGPVVRRIAAVDAVAPFGVAPDVVLRELVSLAVAHSKSTVPAALLADVDRAASRLMRHVVLADLDQHRSAEATPTARRHAAGRARRECPLVLGRRSRCRMPGSTRRMPRIVRSWTTRSTPCAWCVRPTRCVSAARRCAPPPGTRSSSTPTRARRSSRCAPRATTASCCCAPTAR